MPTSLSNIRRKWPTTFEKRQAPDVNKHVLCRASLTYNCRQMHNKLFGHRDSTAHWPRLHGLCHSWATCLSWNATVSASCVVPNIRSELTACCARVSAFVDNWGPAASLSCLLLLVKIFALYVRNQSVVEHGFVHKFAFDKKHLKHLTNVKSAEKRWQLKRCQIWIWNLLHP